MPAKNVVELEISGRTVRITSPEKIFFPERGETKLDLVEYYLAVGDAFLAAVGGRPTLLQRFPDGVGGKNFFQKRVPKGAPAWLETTTMSTPNGTTSNAMVVADLAHVAWAVNMGCLGFHIWPVKAATPGTVDELKVDLDPSPGVDFAMLAEAASELKTLLDEHGLASYPKTSGNRGIHVHVPTTPGFDSYDVRGAAVMIARELAARRSDLCTDAWWKEERGSRVFIDFNQNAPHKTVFGAWSARSRVGGQVSMPFRWDELTGLDPNQWTLATVPPRLAERGDPWAGMRDHDQTLAPFVDQFRRSLADGVPDAPWPPVYPKMPFEPPRVAPSRAKDADPTT